jgi:hypothetical protein
MQFAGARTALYAETAGVTKMIVVNRRLHQQLAARALAGVVGEMAMLRQLRTSPFIQACVGTPSSLSQTHPPYESDPES